MHLPIRAQGTTLTDEQAKILDDEFFLSNPLSHFSSRVSMLLETARSSYEATPENEPEFFNALGLDSADTALKFDAQHRSVQVAIDALSLRHQAAEALTRFIYARVAATPRKGDAKSTWLAVADSPTPMTKVIEANKAALDADPHRFLQLLFPPGTVVQRPVVGAAETAVAWANHAVWLLTNDELSINAAHNKLKHGLATSARGDVRIELITTPPNEDSTIPASAFGEGKSIPLFDRPMLTYLSRPPKELRQGLEAVSLRVDLPVVLAETWMMANVYAAMFHIAAREHYGENLPEGVAPYPTLVVGRLPEHVIGGRPLGYRSAVTLPPDGTTAPRPSGVAFFKQFWPMIIDFESKTEGVVVDG
ncbi:hypothetical protein [Gulosibacter chungangensis]|uniref:Uncharacterized protein n=1 Tax=Gulosibacter chungangensis TaxID=979746 RepID=A0A7J5B793_9MICO|nr:hypothetical protein [Gulosibacter chungangensis]KAB1640690.1 hypothetical protein F8O05_14320 [Gulosibacter chungangensis]